MYLVLNMLMYITGVSGCGKSTLIEELDSSGFLKEMNIIMGTYAYGSGILPLLATSDYVALQKYIYHMMIAQHMVYQKSGYAMLLDRCPIDWECYTQTYMELGLYKYMDVAEMQTNFRLEIDLKPVMIKSILVAGGLLKNTVPLSFGCSENKLVFFIKKVHLYEAYPFAAFILPAKVACYHYNGVVRNVYGL